MEEHPIPQNVTQFEFHLVGDMTLKQFGYLAAGLASGYLTFILISAKLPFVAYPLIVIFVLLGVAFAFLPISERPLDHWVKAYVNAVFAPTQMVYKSDVMATNNPYYNDRLSLYLDTVPEVSAVRPAPKLGSLAQQAPTTQQIINTPPEPKITLSAPQPVAQPLPQPLPPQPAVAPPPPPMSPLAEPQAGDDLNKVVEYAKEAQILDTEIKEAKKQLDEIKSKAAQPGNNPQDFQDKYQKAVSEIQILSSEATQVSKELADLTKLSQPEGQPKVQVVSAQNVPTEKFVSLTTVPNMVNGVVTDTAGNYLEGVIVVTHDKDDLPVRALKTNKLGQFLAATPLPDGVYTLTFEKDSLNFDILQVTLNGAVMAPIRISAKGGGLSQ